MRKLHLLLIFVVVLTQFCDILAQTTELDTEHQTTQDAKTARRPKYAYAGCVTAGFTIAFIVLFVLTCTGTICKGQKKSTGGRQLDEM
uniref:Transmembrane protein n=1 Tax=Panagrellus redivivus TaxID=6233 RepID=A0A7E4VXA1_PANRE